jgi:hypothetical protein
MCHLGKVLSTLETRPPHHGTLIWNLVQVLDKLERGAL